jgi:hypothetical protein
LSLLRSSIIIIGEVKLGGSKTIIIQNWFYLGKRLKTMMKLRNVGLYKTRKILALLIFLLKNELAISILKKIRIYLDDIDIP